MAEHDNGAALRALLQEAGLSQAQALALFNKGQAKPMAMRTLKTYLAKPDSKTRVRCSDEVLQHMQVAIKRARAEGLLPQPR